MLIKELLQEGQPTKGKRVKLHNMPKVTARLQADLEWFGKKLAAATARFARITARQDYDSSHLYSVSDPLHAAVQNLYSRWETMAKKAGFGVEEASEPHVEAGGHDVYGGFDMQLLNAGGVQAGMLGLSFDMADDGKISVLVNVDGRTLKHSGNLAAFTPSALEALGARLTA